MAGDDTTAVEYFKVTEEPLPLNTELHRFGMLTNPFDQVGIGAVERALRRGADHLGTLMDVDLLIAARPGQPISGRTAERILQRAARRAGIASHVSIHTLRHCHASHALKHGKAPIDLVAATLGHTNVATTSKYLHAAPDDSSARYLDGDNIS